MNAGTLAGSSIYLTISLQPAANKARPIGMGPVIRSGYSSQLNGISNKFNFPWAGKGSIGRIRRKLQAKHPFSCQYLSTHASGSFVQAITSATAITFPKTSCSRSIPILYVLLTSSISLSTSASLLPAWIRRSPRCAVYHFRFSTVLYPLAINHAGAV